MRVIFTTTTMIIFHEQHVSSCIISLTQWRFANDDRHLLLFYPFIAMFNVVKQVNTCCHNVTHLVFSLFKIIRQLVMLPRPQSPPSSILKTFLWWKTYRLLQSADTGDLPKQTPSHRKLHYIGKYTCKLLLQRQYHSRSSTLVQTYDLLCSRIKSQHLLTKQNQ